MISGSIDKLRPQGAVGWIDRADANAPAVPRPFLDGEVIGEAVTDLCGEAGAVTGRIAAQLKNPMSRLG